MTQTKIKAKRSSSRIFGVGTGRVREEVGVLDEGVVGIKRLKTVSGQEVTT